MIMSSCTQDERIIVPRNAHKSIFNGLILSGANPIYVQPELITTWVSSLVSRLRACRKPSAGARMLRR